MLALVMVVVYAIHCLVTLVYPIKNILPFYFPLAVFIHVLGAIFAPTLPPAIDNKTGTVPQSTNIEDGHGRATRNGTGLSPDLPQHCQQIDSTIHACEPGEQVPGYAEAASTDTTYRTMPRAASHLVSVSKKPQDDNLKRQRLMAASSKERLGICKKTSREALKHRGLTVVKASICRNRKCPNKAKERHIKRLRHAGTTLQDNKKASYILDPIGKYILLSTRTKGAAAWAVLPRALDLYTAIPGSTFSTTEPTEPLEQTSEACKNCPQLTLEQRARISPTKEPVKAFVPSLKSFGQQEIQEGVIEDALWVEERLQPECPAAPINSSINNTNEDVSNGNSHKKKPSWRPAPITISCLHSLLQQTPAKDNNLMFGFKERSYGCNDAISFSRDASFPEIILGQASPMHIDCEERGFDEALISDVTSRIQALSLYSPEEVQLQQQPTEMEMEMDIDRQPEESPHSPYFAYFVDRMQIDDIWPDCMEDIQMSSSGTAISIFPTDSSQRTTAWPQLQYPLQTVNSNDFAVFSLIDAMSKLKLDPIPSALAIPTDTIYTAQPWNGPTIGTAWRYCLPVFAH